MDINKKTVEIVEEYMNCRGEYISDKAKQMLFELEPYCRDTKIYKSCGKTLKESSEFIRAATSLMLFEHMVEKIYGAPTSIHAAGTPRLMIPLICERLRKEEKR